MYTIYYTDLITEGESAGKRILLYKTTEGKTPFLDWMESIQDFKTRGRIRARIDRLFLGNPGDYKGIGDGVFELRFHFGPGYRVYYGQEGEVLIILLCGGEKSRQDKDIKKAKQYLNDFRRHKHETTPQLLQ